MKVALALALAPLAALAAVIDNNDKRTFLDAEYDYVIVGAGTGGLAMAARLSEDPNNRVAVIEAGGYYQVTNLIIGETPAACALFTGADPKDTNPLVDWNFVTQPLKGGAGRQVHYARGKCIGGTSARNFMVYHRPDKGSMRSWAKAVGDESYTFDNMLPYYQRSVKFTPPKAPPRAANATPSYDISAFDPNAGPVRISYPNYASPITSWLQGALGELGVPESPDSFVSGQLVGATYVHSTLDPDKQKRESSETSYWKETKFRPNVRMYQLVMAKKILFDANKRATGVLLATGATISARKEVILAAGVFQSPQLLMVSGVGPAETLARFNIPIVADRPGVGQNLTDHVFVAPSYRVGVDTFNKITDNILGMVKQFLWDYTIKKQGPLTNPLAEFIGWDHFPRDGMPSDVAAAFDQLPPEQPHFEYITAPGYVGAFTNLFAQQPKDGYQYSSMLGSLGAPFSRGVVTIESADTRDLPLIDMNWMTHPADQWAGIQMFKRMRALYATNAMKPILADPVEYSPGPSVQTDEQILEYIQKTHMTMWHAACTCRMGKRDDPTAVVDSSARVIGVDGLRVVDASAFALLPPGHPQSTIYALAEKISAEMLAGK